jgi:L-asparaginase
MIHVFTTGGTIDKVYFDAQSAFEVGDATVEEIFRVAGMAVETRVEALLRKDSLDLDDADRARIADAVAASPAEHVLVTHGTDTMAATARVVADALARRSVAPKTVVFVGSLAPARFRASDAEFNVGFAAAAVQTLPPGVYVAMNGRVFDPHHVRKDRANNRFEPVHNVSGPSDGSGT